MANVVGERFQITIDRRLREELGVQPGDLAVERVENGRLVVTFMPKPHRRSQLGALGPYLDAQVHPNAGWDGLKERAWAARAEEIMEVLRRDSERHRASGDDG